MEGEREVKMKGKEWSSHRREWMAISKQGWWRVYVVLVRGQGAGNSWK